MYETLDLISRHEISTEQLIESQGERIAESDERLKVFISRFRLRGHKTEGRRGLLSGATISLKDMLHLKGTVTTGGSRILSKFVAGYDATVVERLRAAGAVFVGKTNLHEFAFGVTNINPHYGTCLNPYSESRMCGGSSGGSAVSVATGMCSASIGTDTGGSVRIPASLCGVVGYKPSYGVLSRHGVVPLSWSQDCVGFLTRCVGDALLLARASAGADSHDDTLAPDHQGRFQNLKAARLRGARIGIPRKFFLDVLDKDVRRAFTTVVESLKDKGAKVVDVEFWHAEAMHAARNIIMFAEAASYHQQFKDRFDEYGEDVKDRLAQGMIIPATAYLNAQRARRRFVEHYRALFKSIDVMLTPTTPIPAPLLTTTDVNLEGISLDVRSALVRLTQPFSLLGAPAISLPCGLTPEGLPVGMQLAGDIHGDREVLAFALSLERIMKPISPP